jgi:hypothetical protein
MPGRHCPSSGRGAARHRGSRSAPGGRHAFIWAFRAWHGAL